LGGSGSGPVTIIIIIIIIIIIFPVMADHVTPVIKLRRKCWWGGTCEGEEKCVQSFWCRNLKASVRLEDLGVGGKII
jgi:hypothetical protein